MLNLRFIAGVGVGISGACELPLAWRAHKPLPWALRSSAALALGLAMPHALASRTPSPLSSSSGTEPLTAPPKDAAFSSLSCIFSISLFLSAFAGSFEVSLSFELSLRFHLPRLCRVAVFLIQTNVSLSLYSVIAVIGCRESRPCKMLRAIHFSPLPCSDLGQGVAISTTALMLPRFFVQTHIFSVSPSSFSL